MPAPIGGAFALHRARRHSAIAATIYDPELEAFQKQERFIQANLDCTVTFFKNVIPPGKWNLKGEMVLEAYKDIKFSGIFMLMKGLPVDQTKKLGERHLSNVKFTVEESTHVGGEGGGEFMLLNKMVKGTYELDFEIPEDLPSPVITSEGKCIYRMQAFISTLEGRHVKVAEVPVRWMGSRVLRRKEIDKQLVIEMDVHCKRTLLALGRRRSCKMEWRVEKGGYLPGEGILVEVLGEMKDKGGLEVECLVELVQKVWYQLPSRSGKGAMWVNMKENVLASRRSEEAFEVVGGEDKKVVWMTRIQVPKGITPTQKFELINSVTYAIRASVGVEGENREGWKRGEVPILIGSRKEVIEGNKKKEDDDEGVDLEWGEDEDEQVLHPFLPSGSTSNLHTGSLLQRRGSGGLTMFRKSESMAFIHGRPRVASVSSIEGCQGLVLSTLSILKLPRSYSVRSSLDRLSPRLSGHYQN